MPNPPMLPNVSNIAIPSLPEQTLNITAVPTAPNIAINLPNIPNAP